MMEQYLHVPIFFCGEGLNEAQEQPYLTTIVGMLIICLHIRFHTPHSNGPLLWPQCRQNANFHSVFVLLLFHILQKTYLNKHCIFFKNIYYHTSFEDLILSGASVATTSHKSVYMPFQCHWRWEIQKCKIGVAFNGITFIPNLMKFGQLVQYLKWDHTERMVIS